MIPTGGISTQSKTRDYPPSELTMATIRIEKLNESAFEVTVEARSTTTHTVSLTADYARQLTGGKASTEALIRRSFEFLLEQEPNTSILRQFDLPVIGRYFPEYERTIRALFSSEQVQQQ